MDATELWIVDPKDARTEVHLNDFENIWGKFDNSNGGNFCFDWKPKEIYGDEWGWTQRSCEEKHGFICQFNY